jgi:hypothetical protein
MTVDALIDAAKLLFCVVGRERELFGAHGQRAAWLKGPTLHFSICTLHFSLCTELLAWRAARGRSSPCGGS